MTLAGIHPFNASPCIDLVRIFKGNIGGHDIAPPVPAIYPSEVAELFAALSAKRFAYSVCGVKKRVEEYAASAALENSVKSDAVP